MEEFEYPLREELFQLIQNKRQLRGLLEREALHLRVGRLYFKLTLQLDRYIYARCRRCRSFLKYRREQNGFVLKAFNFSHRHQHRQLNNQIENFIKSMPLTMSTHSLMQITTHNFKITSDKFYYHNRKLWYQKADFKQILKELDSQNNETRLVPFPLQNGQLPDIFLTSTQQMIASFKMFGENQFVTFDVTYNIVKEFIIEEGESNQTKKRRWGLGLFLGKNNNNKPIVFCLCLLNRQTKDSFMGVFKSFFDMMNGEPSSIITDEQASIQSALNQLKEDGDYRGFHLHDTFHILRNISKKTKKTTLINPLRDAMFAPTDEQYKKLLSEARDACEQEQELALYNRFARNANKYCISQTPTCFHGVSISTTFGQKVNDFVKNFFQRQYPYKVVVRKLLKIVDVLQSKSQKFKLCNVNYEEVLDWRQIKLVRFIICEPLFKVFIQNYIRSLSMTIYEDVNKWTVDGYQIEIFQRKLICACSYYEKTGLPCSHLLKAIITTREDILNYINQRWKLQINKSIGLQIPRGRPRDSRRNR